MNRIVKTALATAAALTVGLGVATPAQAALAPPFSVCNGRSYSYLVKTYTYGAQQLALRCGTSSWGLVHIGSARWNDLFDSYINLTINQGEKVVDVQQDGGKYIFALFDQNCRERFRVVYNGGPYGKTTLSPQGIITAYSPNPGGVVTTAEPNAQSLVAASYRTDCAVQQQI